MTAHIAMTQTGCRTSLTIGVLMAQWPSYKREAGRPSTSCCTELKTVHVGATVLPASFVSAAYLLHPGRATPSHGRFPGDGADSAPHTCCSEVRLCRFRPRAVPNRLLRSGVAAELCLHLRPQAASPRDGTRAVQVYHGVDQQLTGSALLVSWQTPRLYSTPLQRGSNRPHPSRNPPPPAPPLYFRPAAV